jgi:pyruvate-formate lyase-activating enzyme
MYSNQQGMITENYPDCYLNIYPVSSESIPMLHFYPNSIFMLISTIGCNFACEGCISEFQTTRKGTLQEILTPHFPKEILDIAREGNCRGITFCLNEPAVSFPTFLRVARVAKKEGFLVGCSSNGYMTRKAVQSLLPYLDFTNIGLKGSTDERYRECGAVSAAPVYRNLKTLYDNGIAVEVSVMYINGREREVIGAAERIRAISPSIPFQVMRFIATHDELEPMSPTREQGEQLCTELRRYLDHVYLFNTPATTELDSRCPVCGKTIIHRVFFGPMAARIISCRPDGVCTCGYRYPRTGTIDPVFEGEVRVLGGYRSIMGAKFIANILIILGITDDREIDRLCNTMIANGYLRSLEEQKDNIETFTSMIRYVSGLAGRKEQAERIINYVQSIFADMEKRVAGAEKPRVYVACFHPLFPVYAAKFVNTIIEIAGGKSLNLEQDFKESTDPEYTVEALNRLDPEVIFFTGHFAPTMDEFYTTCRELGITCRAITEKRVYIMDGVYATGTLGWIIGLMDAANLLHPEIFCYSLADEKAQLDGVINGSGG